METLKKKRIMLAGLAIALASIVGLMVVPAMADEGEDSSTPPEPRERCEVLLGKVADNLGISTDELSSAIVDARLEMVDEALAEGIITEEQAERIKESIEVMESIRDNFPNNGERPHAEGKGCPGGKGRMGRGE
ncbi:MAG: DUF2680 domain-containing protein [Dehalococcoidia bacterium]